MRERVGLGGDRRGGFLRRRRFFGLGGWRNDARRAAAFA